MRHKRGLLEDNAFSLVAVHHGPDEPKGGCVPGPPPLLSAGPVHHHDLMGLAFIRASTRAIISPILTSRTSLLHTMPVSKEIIDQVKQLIPPLNGKLHKGQSGRVGVLGGALECVTCTTNFTIF